MPFQPLGTRRLYERVAEQIAALIRAGEFLPGQRLPAERDLAKTLGVSRPVVREAMIALEIAGHVEVRIGAGAFIRDKSLEPAPTLNAGNSPSDLINARTLIEGEICALASENASEVDLAAIAATIDQMTREHDAGRPWRSADLAFHVAIANATGNAALARVVERLWQEQHSPVFELLSQRVNLSENWRATLNGHQQIFAALLARKPEAAKAALRAHLAQTLEVMTGDAPAAGE
jgi:GntR family transcriptional repressor for pyruvate dehydrogenase complex